MGHKHYRYISPQKLSLFSFNTNNVRMKSSDLKLDELTDSTLEPARAVCPDLPSSCYFTAAIWIQLWRAVSSDLPALLLLSRGICMIFRRPNLSFQKLFMHKISRVLFHKKMGDNKNLKFIQR